MMNHPDRRVAWLMGALTAFAIVQALSIALQRVVYPYELEWLEGGALVQVQRILHGQPLYARPTLDYVAFFYPPLYYYTAAALAQVTGFSFLPLRLVSLLASVGSTVIVARLVQRATGQHHAGFTAVGLLTATYGLALGYYDLARVDALMTLFVLGGFLVAGRTRGGDLLAAGCFALAVFTKQGAVLAVVPYCLSRLGTDRWHATWLLAPMGILVGAGTLLLDHLYGGWYLFYTRDLVGFGGARWGYMLTYVPFMGAVFGFSLARVWVARRSLPLPLLAQASGLIGVALVGKLHMGGAENVMLPGYAGLALLFGAAIGLRQVPLGWLMHTIQMGLLLAYTLVAPLVPTAEHADGTHALVARLQAIPGDVYTPTSPTLAILAGKTPTSHLCAMQEVQGYFGGGDAATWQRLQRELHAALRERRFAVILLPQDMWDEERGTLVLRTEPSLDLGAEDDAVLRDVLARDYQAQVLPLPETPQVQSGWHTYPTMIYVRAESAAGGAP